MPTINLTQLAADSAKPPPTGRLELWDKNLPGFGLRISPCKSDKKFDRERVKVWTVVYRLRGQAKLQRITIGSMQEFPSVAAARDVARDIRQKAAKGEDPKSTAAPAQIRTIAAIVDLFMDKHMRANGRAETYIAETQRIFDQDVLPKWRDRDIKSITRGDVHDLLDGIKDGDPVREVPPRPVQANRTLSAVRKMLNWALDRSYIDASPVVSFTAPTEETSRNRVLKPDELRLIWLAACQLAYPFGPMTKLLILTLQRRNEVAEALWAEFDLNDQAPLWALPADRSKNGVANDIPLSGAAGDIVKALPKFTVPSERKGQPKDCPFPVTTTRFAAVSGFAKAKQRLDEEILKIQRKEAVERGYDPETVRPLPHWTFHDLRRTGTTLMAEDLKILPHVLEAILNHVSGTIKGVAAVYNRASYAEPKRQALDAWAAYVTALPSPTTGSKVPPMRGAK